MSLLAHNCRCGHPHDMHAPFDKDHPLNSGTNKSCSTVACKCKTPVKAESIVLPTFTAWGVPQLAISPPGVQLGARMASCTCGECRALYDARGA